MKKTNNFLKNILITVLLIIAIFFAFYPELVKAQSEDNKFLLMTSEKGDRINAVTICLKAGENCSVNGKEIPIIDYVKLMGYTGIYSFKILTLSEKEYYNITMFKQK